MLKSSRFRKNSWVMLSDSESYTPLPGEQRLYASTARTTLSLQTLSGYPGREPFSRDSGAGCVYLTNRRIIYLPAKPTPDLQSFAAPILNFQDTHVETPWFGPNVWTALVQPVPGGGIPTHVPALQIKMTFKDGGAFDFHSLFEKMKDRLLQAVEAVGGLQNVNPVTTHLDELPAYAAAPGIDEVPPSVDDIFGARPGALSPSPRRDSVATAGTESGLTASRTLSQDGTTVNAFSAPADPPPGYEEVQRDSVAEELERRLRNDQS